MPYIHLFQKKFTDKAIKKYVHSTIPKLRVHFQNIWGKFSLVIILRKQWVLLFPQILQTDKFVKFEKFHILFTLWSMRWSPISSICKFCTKLKCDEKEYDPCNQFDLPMIEILSLLITPLGRRWKSYLVPLTTTVCPALFPPWRTEWRQLIGNM